MLRECFAVPNLLVISFLELMFLAGGPRRNAVAFSSRMTFASFRSILHLHLESESSGSLVLGTWPEKAAMRWLRQGRMGVE